MKRIINFRKLLNVTADTDLATLKTNYRNLMKAWHPDKFIANEAEKAEAEVRSKDIIEAYHFLISIAPETHAFNAEHYTRTTTTCAIEDLEYKGQTLKIMFQDGSSYEYFGVPKNTYNKLISSDAITRFARRHIFHSYTYRNSSKQTAEK
jgi:curved DNA-binding protein CbpA